MGIFKRGNKEDGGDDPKKSSKPPADKPDESGGRRPLFGRGSGSDDKEKSSESSGRRLFGSGGSGSSSGDDKPASRSPFGASRPSDSSSPSSTSSPAGRSPLGASRPGSPSSDEDKGGPRSTFGSNRPSDSSSSSTFGQRSPLGGGSSSGSGSPSSGSRPSFGSSRPSSSDDDDDDDDKPGPRSSFGSNRPSDSSSSSTFGQRSPLGGGSSSGSSSPSSSGRSPFGSSRPSSSDDDDDDDDDDKPVGRSPFGSSRPSDSSSASGRPGSSPFGSSRPSSDSSSSSGSRPGSSFGSSGGSSSSPSSPSSSSGGRPFGGGSSPSSPSGSRPGSSFGSGGGSSSSPSSPSSSSGGRTFGGGSSPSSPASNRPGSSPGTTGSPSRASMGASTTSPATPAKPDDKPARGGLFGRGNKDKDDKKDAKAEKPAQAKGKSADKGEKPGIFGFLRRGNKDDDKKATPAKPKDATPSKASAAPARAASKAKPLPAESKVPRNVTQGLSLDRKLDLLGGALVFVALIMVFGWLQVNLSTAEAQGATAELDIFMAQLFGVGRIVWAPVLAAIGAWLLYRHFGRMFDIDFFRIMGYILLYFAFLATLQWWDLFFIDFPNVVNYLPNKEALAEQSRVLYERGGGGGFFGHVLYIFLHRQLGDWVFETFLFFWWAISFFFAFDLSFEKIANNVIERRNARQAYETVPVAQPIAVASVAAAGVGTTSLEEPSRQRGRGKPAPEPVAEVKGRTVAPSDAPITADTDGAAPQRQAPEAPQQRRGLFGRREAPTDAPVTADTDSNSPERASRSLFGRRKAPAETPAGATQPANATTPLAVATPATPAAEDSETPKRSGLFGRGGRREAPENTVTPETDSDAPKRSGLFGRGGRQEAPQESVTPETDADNPQRGSLLGRTGRRIEPESSSAAPSASPATPVASTSPTSSDEQAKRAPADSGTEVSGRRLPMSGSPASNAPEDSGASPVETAAALGVMASASQRESSGLMGRFGRRPASETPADATTPESTETPATPQRESSGLMGRFGRRPASETPADAATPESTETPATPQRESSGLTGRFDRRPASETPTDAATPESTETPATPQRDASGLMGRFGRRPASEMPADTTSPESTETPATPQRESATSMSSFGRRPATETPADATSPENAETPATPQRDPASLTNRFGRRSSEASEDSENNAAVLAAAAIPIASQLLQSASPEAKTSFEETTSAESPAAEEAVILDSPARPAGLLSRMEQRSSGGLDEDTIPNLSMDTQEFRATSGLRTDRFGRRISETPSAEDAEQSAAPKADTSEASTPEADNVQTDSTTTDAAENDIPATPARPTGLFTRSATTPSPDLFRRRAPSDQPPTSLPGRRPSSLFSRDAEDNDDDEATPSAENSSPIVDNTPAELVKSAETTIAGAALAQANLQATPTSTDDIEKTSDSSSESSSSPETLAVSSAATTDSPISTSEPAVSVSTAPLVSDESPSPADTAKVADAEESSGTASPSAKEAESTPETPIDTAASTVAAAVEEKASAESSPEAKETALKEAISDDDDDDDDEIDEDEDDTPSSNEKPFDALDAQADQDEAKADAPTGNQRWIPPDYREILEGGSSQNIDHQYLLEQARVIEDTLESFGAPGRVVEVNTGPVITQFGVEPNYLEKRGGGRSRVKVSAIAALDRDLALALAAKSIRIEAPVPGKGYVGIEVPNAEASLVSLRDVMSSEQHQKLVAKSKLTISLGKRVDGGAISADLTQMPHLLIAGATGSGKSVAVNAIIGCLLLQNTPDELQFIMVDPKRVELTGYNGVPHLVAPVVVDLERIVGVLKWVQREMDDRYKRFAAIGARNILDFNGKLRQGESPLPYLVVIVDELADLMMLAPEETEKLIARLAQMARATGIHLIISTQRPSVDVVTGLIKANFPARIAFAVASSVDSRVILDQPGAEKLLGRGDMLYQAPDSPAPLRMQGVYVSDAELNRTTHYWKSTVALSRKGRPLTPPSMASKLGPGETPPMPRIISRSERINGDPEGRPVITENTFKRQTDFWQEVREAESRKDDDDLPEGEGDDLYDEAVELVRQRRKASISMLQRHFRIGYTRSARLIDMMEENGVVGPAESGAKPRDVIIE